MSIDDVQDLTPRVQYTAAVSQRNFTYPFPIFADGDLVVDMDGTTLALGTDYTVSGEGTDTGGNVRLVTVATGGELVTIYRDIAIERLTDFAEDGPFSSARFNDELDRMTMVDQQLETRVDRCLRLSLVSPVTSAQLELDMSLFAGKFLAFDDDGVPVPADETVVYTSVDFPGVVVIAGGHATFDGVVTAAGFVVTGSTVVSNGLYLPATDAVALATAGVQRLRASAIGSVSIFAPDSAANTLNLHGISGGVVLNLILTAAGEMLNFTDGTHNARIRSNADGYRFLTTTAGSLSLGANNAIVQVIEATGETTFAGAVATTPVDLGNSGTVIAIDCRESNVFVVDMTGNVSSGNFDLNNPTDGQTITIRLTQGAGGSHTLGFGSSILFPGGVNGILSTDAGAVDILVMTYFDDISKWVATLAKDFS